MSRMETTTLTKLVQSAEGAGYTLPPALMDAWRTYNRVKALEVPEPAVLDAQGAASRIVSATAAGETVDPLAAARQLEQATCDIQTASQARMLVSAATEQAAHLAASLADTLTEQIISEHLRPALEAVYAKTREVAAALDGYGLDPHTLVTAPTKARSAYAALPELVTRRQMIYTARRFANTLGHRKPQHDANGLFAELRDPLALSPEWRPPMPIPQIPAPQDPTERLLWVVSDAAAPAKPWLPAVEEQDAAWWRQFGEGVENRAQRHRDAQAIGGRAPMGALT